MLLRNDLLQYTQPSPRTVRILWISAERDYAYVFDVAASSAEVELVQLSALQADLRAGHARVLPVDPYLLVVSQELLTAKHMQLRARAWQIIEPLVALEPDIYEARRRGQMVAQATADHGVSHPTIYRYLRRYWQRGQTPNALLPDYSNSGGRGKVRQASAGVKRGRPRKNNPDAGPGVNADEDMRRVFRVATAHHVLTRPKFSRLGAYQLMLDDFFVERRIDAETGRVLTTPSSRSAELPTFGQFNYWLDHDDDRPPEVSRRNATVVNAPGSVAATPAAIPDGRPGDSFYLDAVRAEVQLVSRADRNQAIGRPLVYVVTDTFSRMVTGIHIGLGDAQWPHAMLALANCGADKQSYCQRHGRGIEAAQWPCRHLPDTLYANAELTLGWSGETLRNNFNLRCVAVDDGPSEWRAVLEKRFRLLRPSERGAACRLDGVLDLGQFTRIVLDCVLYYNQRLPLQLWDWGVAHRAGKLKAYSEHLVRCSLMPVATASVTADGIALNGGLYTCPCAVNERWFERARARGEWHVKVAYDPSCMDMIYLLHTPMQFHACHLTAASAACAQLSVAEVARLPRQISAAAPRGAVPSLVSLIG